MRVVACILNESSVHRDSDLAVYTNNNVAVRHFPLVMNHFDAHFSIFWHGKFNITTKLYNDI